MTTVTDGHPARRTLLLALGLAPLLAAAAATPAWADPAYPAQGDVDAARVAAEGVAREVAGLQTQLSQAQSALDAARTDLSVATEDYHEARALLAQRTDESTAAVAEAVRARAAHEAARTAVDQLASQRYRTGAGDLGPLVGVLGATSPSDLADRSATLEHLAGRREDVAQQAEAAELWAQTTARRAQDAQAAQRAATDATAAARAGAAAAADTATTLVASTRTRTDAFVARLALLRQTSVALEQQRQAGLAAEQREREEAAARAAAEAAAVAAVQAAEETAASSGSGSSVRAPGTATVPVRRASAPTAGAATAVDWALGQIGKPYLWGGDGPDSFDCSGLTMRAWQAAGASLPHSSRLQYSGQAKVALGDLEPGDLVFYATDTTNPSTVHHVGMVVSAGTMVEAPHTGALVRTSSIYRSGLLPWGTRPA